MSVTFGKVHCDSESTQQKSKVFNDPIHGHIELPEMCVRIIDTPEFQRLRYIKQLGATYRVYPGATHNRFEHSLGTCYLAGNLVQHLMNNQPELLITERDKQCVQIAGLCHDLGHGPLSHLFESHFIRKLDPSSKWSHEDASLDMFDHLLKNNKLLGEKDFQLEKQDVTFIKEIIHRSKDSNPETGRGRDKDFLYEVVSNKENGIDVDKWDYFARDCYHLGFKNNFDHNRLVQFLRVIEVEDETTEEEEKKKKRHICYRDKEVEHIYHMFYSRVILHRRACQHKTTNIIEVMFMKALRKANDHYLRITGKDGTKLKISECIHDMVAYSTLTDRVFDDIRASEDSRLAEAKKILDQIENRQHYKCVGSAIPKMQIAKNELRQKESEFSKAITQLSEGQLRQDDFLIHIAVFDYGFDNKNPVDNVYFYSKNSPDKAFRIRREYVSHLLPVVYSEKHVLMYSKNPSKNQDAKRCFNKWCKSEDMDGIWKLYESP